MDQAKVSWGWTRRQRIGLGTLLLTLLAILMIQFVRRPSLLMDPKVVVNGHAVSLPQRIDPNTATLEELARIPHIGETLAGKIIAFRDSRRTLLADGVVFHRPENLDAVPGVGKKLIEQLTPYLQFPEDADTEPSQ